MPETTPTNPAAAPPAPPAKLAAPSAAATAPAAPAAAAPAVAEDAPPKVKTRKPRQRACDEKDDKGKLCCGHLKRYYDYPKEIEELVGKNMEVYRCEFCHTIYKPNLGEMQQSYTLRT
jgi:hypothetical protein